MTLEDLKSIIINIPVMNQISVVNLDSWKNKFTTNKECEKDFDSICRDYPSALTNKVELTRDDILREQDPKRKIIMTLMWGYPTGGRGQNIMKVLAKIDDLNAILTKSERSIPKQEFYQLLDEFKKIDGLGPSTWSKLLYFFQYTIDENKCQIYDLKIVDSLNERKHIKEISELTHVFKHDKAEDYLIYIKTINDWARRLDADDCLLPDKLELFLFYYNLNYKMI